MTYRKLEDGVWISARVPPALAGVVRLAVAKRIPADAGLGDTIHRAAQRSGVEAAASWAVRALGLRDCGCSDRRAWLNEQVRYDAPAYGPTYTPSFP